MLIQTALILTIISLVSSNDLELGPKDGGRKILDELRKASPLLWKRENAVYVRTTDDELIHRIFVTDLRDHKDGIAKVVEGGVGENEVLIELSSPGVLKGYEFHVEVYSTPNPNAKPKDNTAVVKDVTNQTPENSRIIGLGRQRRSWFGASGEDYGSYSDSGESDESVKPLEKKPSKEEKPKTPDASTEKPQIPLEPTIASPRQIIDSLPPLNASADESTAIPSTVQPEVVPEGSQSPDLSSPQPLPLADSSLSSVPPTLTADVNPTTLSVNPTTFTADTTQNSTSPSLDTANVNATTSSSSAPGQ